LTAASYNKEWLTEKEWAKISAPKGLNLRDKLILHLLYVCAFRISELLNLRVEDVNLEEGFIIIRKSKNEPHPRVVPLLVPKLIKMIQRWFKEMKAKYKNYRDEDWLLPGRIRKFPLDRRTVFYLVNQAAKQAGITKKLGTHTFRRSRITHLIDADVPIDEVQLFARHKKIDTTTRYYKYSQKRLRQVLEKLDPLLQEK
jgi:integrase/recombinase XerD